MSVLEKEGHIFYKRKDSEALTDKRVSLSEEQS